MRKTNEATIEVIENREGTHWLVRILTPPSRAIDQLFDRVHRFVHVWRVAHYFDTDMASARVLLQEYYGKQVWFEETADEPVLIHPPLDPKFIEETTYTIPFDYGDEEYNRESKDANLERAMDIFSDFSLAIFEEEGMMKEDGVLTKGVIAPWAKRSDLPGPVKERVKMIIGRIRPPIFFQNQSNLWQFNIVDYPNAEAAKTAIENVYETWGEEE